MRLKIRNGLLIAAVLIMSVLVWTAALAQDATEEPGAASTVEPGMTTPSTVEPMTTAEPDATGQHGFLGVALQDAYAGVTVAQVVDGSAAADAGLQVGDVIKAINGETLDNSAEAAAIIGALDVGDEVTLDVMRGSDTMTVTVTLGEQMQPTAIPGQGRGNRGSGNGNGRNNPPNNGNRQNHMFGLQYNAQDQTWTITNLSEGNPLYDAGLREGDVITGIDGNSVDPASLGQYLQSLDDDATVTLNIERDGAAQDIEVHLSDLAILLPFGMQIQPGNLPGNGNGYSFQFPGMGGMFGYGNGRLGVTFVTLNEQTAQENDVTTTEGALITAVDDSSPAADAGLQVGDIVTAVNGEPVDEERTLRDRLIAYEPGDTVTLTVLRDGDSQDIDVTLGEQADQFGMMPMFPNIPFRLPPLQQGQPTPETTPQANL